MKSINSRQWVAPLLILLIPLFLMTACQPGTTTEPERAQAPAVTENEPAEAQAEETNPDSPDDSPSDEILVQGDIVFGPGTFDFPDPSAGLAELGSYTATLNLSFIGTEAGQPSQWTKVYVMRSSLQPAARKLSIEKTGQLDDLEPVFMAEMNGAAYEWHGENTCITSVWDPETALSVLMEPALQLNGVIGADETVDSGTVNGVAAKGYTFDERALNQSGMAKSTGELWIASEGGYIVKYVLSTKAGPDYFGEGIDGTITWDYELTGANQPAAFMLPDDCPGGMIIAPRLPDAADMQDEPGFISYITASSPAEAAAFYQNELPALGWSAGESIVSETMAVQYFSKDGQQLALIITSGMEGTTVQLILSFV